MASAMSFKGAQVLITDGSTGVGFGLAARFVAAGATVLVAGRSMEKLAEAKRELRGPLTTACDVSDADAREALALYAMAALPALAVIVNCAGVQRRVPLAIDTAPWSERQHEIDTLFSGAVHLNHLLIPRLVAGQGASLIVNVTSGGAFVPQVSAPLYSASKAALHSYTVTLRHALAKTRCRVVELIPPAVRTPLADGAAAPHGVPLDPFCDSVFAALVQGDADEIGYGPTEGIARASTSDRAGAFETSAARFDVPVYVPSRHGSDNLN